MARKEERKGKVRDHIIIEKEEKVGNCRTE